MERKTSIKWFVSNSFWGLCGHILPTKIYLSLRYRIIFGKWINWKNPTSFTEKLQWLKVYGHGEQYTHLVDKLLVKDYVASIVGEKYVIPTLAVWDSIDSIDSYNLPNQFVMKCNHDSGSIVICNDKATFDCNEAKKAISKVFRRNYYFVGRETPYKRVHRKVFAEKLIRCTSGGDLKDYKFFCFNGMPRCFKIDFDRFVDHHANYYDMHQNLLPFGEVWPSPDQNRKMIIPDNFDEMVSVASSLSRNIPFARVDLYNNDGVILFGEITLYPTSGFGPFTDPEWDLKLGEWLDLSTV